VVLNRSGNLRAANIQITQLPFNIKAPGTYVLVGNLNYTVNSNAITINTPLSGPVVVDSEGYTITGSGAGPGGRVTVGINISGTNIYPITVRNGIIQNFAFGVYAFSNSGVYVNNLDLNTIYEGVYFGFVNSSTISDYHSHCFYPGIQPVHPIPGKKCQATATTNRTAIRSDRYVKRQTRSEIPSGTK
jgi:hypothetical protein